jgi:hypothetical protein
MATYRNFSISRGKGKLYLKEKQPTEGFEEVTYGEGKKTYHQYHNKIEGVPNFFGVKEVQHEGRTLKFLELSLEDGDTINKVSVNLKNKGGYTDEAKALISALKGLEMGERMSLAVHKSTSEGKNGKTYENLNIYLNYLDRKDDNGKNPSTGFINYTDIPAPTSREVAGETVWDWAIQTEFYYTILQEIEERFKSASAGNDTPAPETPKSAPEKAKNTAKTPAASNANSSDDLPF